MGRKQTCGETHEAIVAPDPDDSIIYTCVLEPHDDDGHMDENGFIWSEAGDAAAEAHLGL